MPLDAQGYWYDDGTDTIDDYEPDYDLLGLNTNMFLGGAGGFGSGLGVPGDLSKYGDVEATDVATGGRMGNYTQDILQMLFDPRLGMLNNALTGAPTFDYGQMFPGMGIEQIGTGAGLGGGGGGGYGGGGGAVSAVPPPTFGLQRALTSDNEIMRDIATRMQGGADAGALKLEYADPSSGITNPTEIDVINSTIDQIDRERNDLAAWQAQGAAMPGSSNLSETASKWGLPVGAYTPDDLPGDVNANKYLHPYEMPATVKANLQRALRDATYAPIVSNFEQRAGDDGSILRPVPRPGGYGTEGPYERYAERHPLATERNIAVRGIPGRPEVIGDFGVGGEIGGGDFGDRTGPAQPVDFFKGGALANILGTPAPSGQQDRRPDTGVNAFIGVRQTEPFNRGMGPVHPDVLRQNRFLVTNPVSGQKSYTNAAGNRASRIKYATNKAREMAADTDTRMREYIARDLANQGRTRQGDALRSNLNLLRSMGLPI